MTTTEDEIIEKFAKQFMHCIQNTFLPDEHGWTGTACGYIVKKRKNQPTKIQRKK